jgi:hypothetical protein
MHENERLENESLNTEHISSKRKADDVIENLTDANVKS